MAEIISKTQGKREEIIIQDPAVKNTGATRRRRITSIGDPAPLHHHQAKVRRGGIGRNIEGGILGQDREARVEINTRGNTREIGAHLHLTKRGTTNNPVADD